MSTILLTSDWNIGKTHPKIDLEAELMKGVTNLILEAKEIGAKAVIHTGDFWHSKRFATLDMMKTYRKIKSMFHEAHIPVHVIVGKGDAPARQIGNGETMFDFDEDAFLVFDVHAEPELIHAGELKIAVIPSNSPEDIKVPADAQLVIMNRGCSHIKVEGKTILTAYSQDNLSMFGDDVAFIYPLYQTSDDDDLFVTGYIKYDTSSKDAGTLAPVTVVPNLRRLFASVNVVEGKIEGKNPVKWVMDNVQSLKGTVLTVVADDKTDTGTYLKLLSVLDTIGLAELKAVDRVEFTETEISETSMKVVDLIEAELPSTGGSKELLRKIAERVL